MSAPVGCRAFRIQAATGRRELRSQDFVLLGTLRHGSTEENMAAALNLHHRDWERWGPIKQKATAFIEADPEAPGTYMDGTLLTVPPAWSPCAPPQALGLGVWSPFGLRRLRLQGDSRNPLASPLQSLPHRRQQLACVLLIRFEAKSPRTWWAA